MQDLSFWTQFFIVAAAVVLGPVVALMLALTVTMLLRWVGPADAPPPPVLVAIDLAAKFLRKRLAAGEPLRSDTIRTAHVNPARPAAN